MQHIRCWSLRSSIYLRHHVRRWCLVTVHKYGLDASRRWCAGLCGQHCMYERIKPRPVAPTMCAGRCAIRFTEPPRGSPSARPQDWESRQCMAYRCFSGKKRATHNKRGNKRRDQIPKRSELHAVCQYLLPLEAKHMFSLRLPLTLPMYSNSYQLLSAACKHASQEYTKGSDVSKCSAVHKQQHAQRSPTPMLVPPGILKRAFP